MWSFMAFMLLVWRLMVSSRVILVHLMSIVVGSVMVRFVAMIPAEVLIINIVVEVWNELMWVLVEISVFLPSPVSIIPRLMVLSRAYFSFHGLVVRVV